jgi:hypothetical protein
MADTSGLPNLDGLIDKLVEGLFEPGKLQRIQAVIRNANAEAETVADAAHVKAVQTKTADESSIKDDLESVLAGLASWVMATAVEGAFGVEVSQTDFFTIGATQGRAAVSRRIAAKMVEALTGGSKSIEPSEQPAARYLDVVIGQAFESWAVGTLVEIGSAAIPFLEQIQTVGDIGNRIVNALGITDSSSRVLRPYIDTLVVEPLRRHIASTYTPNLLSESLAVRQYLRGEWQREELDKEMRVLGWDPRRVDAHINNAEKFVGFEDSIELSRGAGWDVAKVVDNLKQQGYREQTAFDLVAADARKRIRAIKARALGPLLDAYKDRQITEGDLRNELIGIFEDQTERDLHVDLAKKLRGMNSRELTHTEVVDCVELGILPRFYYRAWLERQGYGEFEAAALETRLRLRMDKDARADTERARVEAERAAEKAAKAAAAAQRRAEIEAQRALQRRGSPADLERAVIRGRIPIARLAEVLAPDVDADTLEILLGLVADDRETYRAQQEAADAAKTRGAVRRLDVGALESAVEQKVLTLEEYGRRLGQLGFTSGDAALLVATLRERLADRAAAERKHAEAEQRAAVRRIDLGRFETLVRRGLRTLAQYRALLASLEYDDGAVDAMAELLELKIGDDAAAAAARRDADARLETKGISLEQMRRAVILGLRDERELESLLIAEGFTSDAQALILAELRADVAEADAARQRRATAGTATEARRLSVDRLARAVRLGVVDVDTYAARLADEGFSADDIGVELELLAVEIADAHAAERRRDELNADSQARGLSLGELARAVKAGAASLEAYRARAATLGYAPADIELLVAVLQTERDALADARARRTAIGAELGDRNLGLSQLEQAVKAGLKTIEEYIAGVRALGYGADDAELLAMLVEIGSGAAPPEG